MHILKICPLWHPISKDSPGGIETLVAQLIPALQKLGCHITLLATGDSRSSADLIPVIPVNLCQEMHRSAAYEYAYYEQHQLQIALSIAQDFDIIHSHIGGGGYILSGIPSLHKCVLHTIHSPILSDHEWFVCQHPDLWFSTVSQYQACKLWKQGAKHCQVIHNGIDFSEFFFQEKSLPRLFYIGRMEWIKGPDLAVQVARQLNFPLTLAGPIVEPDFFEATIKPHLSDRIEYVGIVDHQQKNILFGQSACGILPFRGEEPFGQVAIEAMACGMPIVAMANGALPEIVDSGVTGYLAHDQGQLRELVHQAIKLDRKRVRIKAKDRFDIAVVAQKYNQLYLEMVNTNSKAPSLKT